MRTDGNGRKHPNQKCKYSYNSPKYTHTHTHTHMHTMQCYITWFKKYWRISKYYGILLYFTDIIQKYSIA